MEEGKIRSVIAQKDGSTLIEVDSDTAANWLANHVNSANFAITLGEGIKFRWRTYNVLAFNVPLAMDPDDAAHREEINEVNDLEECAVMATRWAKPINRRSIQQRSAHLILSFASPEAANHAISNGIIICHKKCHVERLKKEPIRCLKCQGWNHMARDCTETKDRCSNCAGEHNTAICHQPRTKRCVSCNSNDHASWDRECPTFRRKVSEFNERNPENSLPLFPTADPWTWSAGDANATKFWDRHSVQKPATKDTSTAKRNKGKSRETQGQCDTYFPNYDNPRQPLHPTQRSHPPPSEDWWARQGNGIYSTLGSPNGHIESAQQGNTNTGNSTGTTNNNNSGNTGPSDPHAND
jgi:hypothetical protein